MSLKHLMPPLANPIDFDRLETLDVAVYWKNRQGEYQACNDKVAIDAGLVSNYDIIGKTDFDLPWADSAEQFRLNDQWIETHGRVTILPEFVKCSDGTQHTVISVKLPLNTDKGEFIGTGGVSIKTDGKDFSSVMGTLLHIAESLGLKIIPFVVSCPDPSLENGKAAILSLSQRERQVLQFIVNNKTAKEIAEILKISRRTVEAYTSNLKDKLGVVRKSELIAKVLHMKLITTI